jgi:hypothetical protein
LELSSAIGNCDAGFRVQGSWLLTSQSRKKKRKRAIAIGSRIAQEKEVRMTRRRAVIALTTLGFAAGVTGWSEQVKLVATGTVVEKKSDKLVIRTADHGHRITFEIDRSTSLPDGLGAGTQVQIDYRANGDSGQTAERVTVVERRAASRR